MQCQCCKNHDAECLIPPLHAPFGTPTKGLRIPACIRCGMFGYQCSNLDNVPNDHRWYPRADGTYEHKPAPKSVIKEEDANCRRHKAADRGGKQSAQRSPSRDHDHLIEERKWEPHFETYKFIRDNPWAAKLILDPDIAFEAKGGSCHAQHAQHAQHSGSHCHSATCEHNEGVDDSSYASSSSSSTASSSKSTIGSPSSSFVDKSSDLKSDKDDSNKANSVQIVTKELSHLTASLLHIAQVYAETIMVGETLKAEQSEGKGKGKEKAKDQNAASKGGNFDAEMWDKAKSIVHANAVAQLEGFKDAVKQIEEAVLKKLSTKGTAVSGINNSPAGRQL
ncbi:hypothetical protein IAU59_001304 [Kwoniella sp. CBS 9459]